MICFQTEGCAAHPVRYNSPLHTTVHVFLNLNLNLLGRVCQPDADEMVVWHTSNFEKSAPNDHYYLQRAATPDQVTQQNKLQRAGWP
jgi:hypothetical protein